MKKYDFNTCTDMMNEMVSECRSWGIFVNRAHDFLVACLNDNDISYWEYYDLEKSIRGYWGCFNH